MKIIPRPYQRETVDSIFNYLREKDGNPLAVLPTGSGKSICIGTLAKECFDYDPNVKILALQHQKELIEQNLEKFLLCSDNQVPAGIYCAGMGKKELNRNFILASIKSVFQIADKLGYIDLIIIDECHLLSPKQNTMYGILIAELKAINPKIRIIGFTATPFRMSTGMLTDDDGFFDDICINVPIKQLIKDGYLSPVVSKAAVNTPDLSEVKIRGGEYVESEVEKLYNKKVSLACYHEFLKYGSDRKSVLVFCSGVKHAESFASMLRSCGETAECISGKTLSLFREQNFNAFKNGKLRFLVTVGVATTGFDAPGTDCLMMLRATKSPGLYVQIVGRGMRTAPNKTDCLMLDFGGNIERHGPVDLIEVRKAVKKDDQGKNIIVDSLITAEHLVRKCPKCLTINSKYDEFCISCKMLLPVPGPDLDKVAAQGNIISSEYEDFEIVRVEAHLHKKEDKPDMVRLEYIYAFGKSVKQYFCFDHKGYACIKARENWAKIAKDPRVIPESTEYALFAFETGDVKEIEKIRCRRENGFLVPVAWRFKGSRKPDIPAEQDETEEQIEVNL